VDPELKALRQLKRRIGVKRSDKAYWSIYVTTKQGKSVRVADAIAQAYLDDQTNARATASGRASDALTAGSTRCVPACRRRDSAVQYKEQHKIIAPAAYS